MLSPRHVLAVALALCAWSLHAADGEKLPPVVMYAPSPCLSCIDWADHLRKHGFEVTVTETEVANMPRLKRWLSVPQEVESVHTATVARLNGTWAMKIHRHDTACTTGPPTTTPSTGPPAATSDQ